MCNNPVTHKIRLKDGTFRVVTHGCGQCENCLKKRTNDWIFRCEWEARKFPYNWVVTLTYADEFLNFTDKGNATLCKRDFQLFMKRLRQRYPNAKLRYLVRGEYGGMFGRPHYHVIFFGLPASCKEEVGYVIDDLWYYGSIYVDTYSDASVRYITNYLLKADDFTVYEDSDIVRPYINVSQRPAIGANFLDSDTCKRAVHQNDYVIYGENNVKRGIPRYLSEKMDDLATDNPISRSFRRHDRQDAVKRMVLDCNYPENYHLHSQVDRAEATQVKKRQNYLRNKAKKH